MQNYAKALGAAVRQSRLERGLTQSKVSEIIDSTPRTILNIEKGIGNPKLHILYPLIRFLRIDVNRIFYPERDENSPTKQEVHILIDQLTEEEALILKPVMISLINLLRRKDPTRIGSDN